MSASFCLVAVGHHATPVFEMEILLAAEGEPRDNCHLNQIRTQVALDLTGENVAARQQVLKTVGDSAGGWFQHLLPRSREVPVLRDTRQEDGIKNFFTEVYDLHIKFVMNPFDEPNSPI